MRKLARQILARPSLRSVRRVLRYFEGSRPRFLNFFPKESQLTESSRRINFLNLGKIHFLEIGVQDGFTFEGVRSARKLGVDPYAGFHTWWLPYGAKFSKMDSAAFFSRDSKETFDFIFIDGLHTAEASYEDFIGAANMIADDGGVILIDDVLPSDFLSSLPTYAESKREKKLAGIDDGRWYGDVWRLAWLLISEYEQLDIVLIGNGSEEHCQAAVLVKPGLKLRLESKASDLDFMMSLRYEEVVDSGPTSIRGRALNEETGLKLALDMIHKQRDGHKQGSL